MAELMSESDLSDLGKIAENIDFQHFDEKLMAELMAEPDFSDFVQN